MNTKKIIASIVSVATGILLLSGITALPLIANAQAGVNTSVNVGVNAINGGSAGATVNVRLSKVLTRSDTAILARIASLNDLNTRIQAMSNVSVEAKANISNQIQGNISGLTSLKAKIDADTSETTALSDEKSILGSYRIYALVLPQGYIAAASDRILTIAGLMTNISAKLEARITADRTAGKDVSAMESSLIDLNLKITDAKLQASTAETRVAPLAPDMGNKVQLQTNNAALKAARADVKVGTQDLKTARSDADSIIKAVKALGIDGSSKTTTSTSVTTH